MDPILESLQEAAVGICDRRKRLDSALDDVRRAVQSFAPYADLNLDTGEIYETAQFAGDPADETTDEQQEPPEPPPPAPPEPSPTPVEAPEPPSPVEPSGDNGHDAEADEEVRRDARGRRIVVPPWYERTPIIEAEQRKKRIVDLLAEKAPKKIYAVEIANALNIERQQQVVGDLKDLVDRGVKIVMIPNHGRPPGMTTGRFSNAYYATNDCKYIDPDGGDRDPLALTVPQ
jgi:hypothetical protein